MRRSVRAVLTTSAILAAAATAPTAADAADLVHCTGDFTRTFIPAVTATPQTVTVTETDTYSSCPAGPAGGIGSSTIAIALSCVPAGSGPAFVETITWNDSTTSTIAWNAPTVAANTVVFSGTVTAGRFDGDTTAKITSGLTYPLQVLPCLLGTPITQTTGLVDSLIITG